VDDRDPDWRVLLAIAAVVFVVALAIGLGAF
jgi:anti-sigma-K factor RskA